MQTAGVILYYAAVNGRHWLWLHCQGISKHRNILKLIVGLHVLCKPVLLIKWWLWSLRLFCTCIRHVDKNRLCYWKAPLYSLYQWFSTWVMCPSPKGGHTMFVMGHSKMTEKLGGLSKFWVGHRSFTARIKYFKFKTESKVPFSPASPAALKAKLYFIAVSDFTSFNLVSVRWFICCQKYLTASTLWSWIIFAYH
jgi:hypothetical protein